MKLRHIWLILLLLLVQAAVATAGGPFVAYSLKVAESRLQQGKTKENPLRNLGSITAVAGLVYDSPNKDLIIVGRANPGQAEINLDDLVVALRSVLVLDDFPLVSIDRTPETKKTGKQTILFKGGIAQTQFGRDLLTADIALKKLALGQLPDNNWGIRSYFDMLLARAQQTDTNDLVGSRFWFYILGKPALAAREEVFVIREMQIGIKTEVLYAMVKGKPVANLSNFKDANGDAFSAELTKEYLNLCPRHPELGRVKTLLDLVSLAKGVKNIAPANNLDFWLKRYTISMVETLTEYDLLRRQEKVPGKGGKYREVELNGGIELRAKVLRLKAGDASALKEVVLQSRPQSTTLTWTVPLEGWEIPGALPVDEATRVPSPGAAATSDTPLSSAAQPGCSLEAQVRAVGSRPLQFNKPLPAPKVPIPRFEIYRDLVPQSPGGNSPAPLGGDQAPGGVTIDPKLEKKGTGGLEVKKDVLKSRPSEDSLSWPIPGSKGGGK
jgi:hypothetical protein